MKKLTIQPGKWINNLPTFIVAVYFTACSGAGGTTIKSSDTKVNAASPGDSVYYGKNSVSYTIGGHTFAIKDQLKLGEGKYTGALFLNVVENNKAAGMVRLAFTNSLTSEVFNFYVHGTGTTAITHYKANISAVVNGKDVVATYMAPHYGPNYYGDSVSVTIIKLTADRVSGSFSGRFTTDDNKSSLTISQGSFDMALSKSNQ